MKNVLDYNDEELLNFTIEELEVLAKECESKENEYNTRQLTEKVLINGLYGCLANRHFVLFNEEMAAAITGNGRYFIQKMSNYIEERLQSILPSNKLYILYNDTDAAYYHIEPFMAKYQEQNPNLTLTEYTDWVNSFEEKVIQPIIQQSVDDFARELNAYNKDVIKAEREIIADCVTGKAGIKIIDESNNVVNLSMSKFAKNHGINIHSKNNEVMDLSDKNILILSYNNETQKNELKQILNIQKKITTKPLVDLIAPNGKKLRCTEDHLIAVLYNDEIIYKMAKDITELDDVQIYDNTFYTKQNCELYNTEYINYGANRTDLIKKGINISKSKRAKFILTKNKRQTLLNDRINKILEKHSGKYFKFILRLVDIRKKKLTRNKILNFLKNSERIKKLNLNIELLQKLIYIKHQMIGKILYLSINLKINMVKHIFTNLIANLH